MGAINAYSGEDFPGAVTTLEADLDIGDCNDYPSMEALVKQLQGPEEHPTTIRDGRAYTEATTAAVATLCGVA